MLEADLEELADQRFRTGLDDGGLTAAHALGDETRMARIIDRWGVDLAHSPHGALMFEVAAQLPLDLAKDLPGLAFRFEDIGRLPIGTTPLGLPATAEEAQAEFARQGDLRLRQALLPLVTRRRLGRFDEALAIVQAAVPLADAIVYPWYGDRGRILPYWHLQCGITAQVAGDLDAARRWFMSAWTHHARDPYGFVARATAGKLALVDAARGHHVSSTTWLERAREQSRRPDLWIDGFVESNLTATEAIHASDGLDPQTEHRLGAMPHPTQRGEQWSVLLWIHVRHALTQGDASRASRTVDDALAAQRAELTGGGLAQGLVRLLRAEIHLALGQANQALTVLADAPDIAGAAAVLRGRTLLLSGRPTEALHVAEAVVQDHGTSLRAGTEALLVVAAARHASGDRAGAVAAALRAVGRVQEQRVPRALATVPRVVLDDLAADVPGLAELLALLDERGIVDIYPASVPLITVTKRERDLLSDLSSGISLTQIAKANFVSINTTRTHLANLRRKLDARSRDEVVARARQLGLLRQPPHD
ncbi:helix-turn-helix transcriptional regulator [Pimelobacter simplex]|uniref:Transcriptional regulator, LuxR family n=1 Tax=Nocardioides simplex TaxID=2045 RepID=A0A0A1DV06_NOCSI|nr:LuxR C-terminal-related transcriptional regulator [Pimelobacter simplex]AIY19260.1 Transcriptional regulator, LuxR family [Pimelobacter simplex]